MEERVSRRFRRNATGHSRQFVEERPIDLQTLIIMAGVILGFALISGRLEGTVLTPPLVMAAIGLLISPVGLGVAEVDLSHSAIEKLAELTLILVLFSDAARVDLRVVRSDHSLPKRMLLLGLPLAMLLGALIAHALFPEFSFWEAALLAALLAPTDAALGQAVVSMKAIPLRIRQTINIESGLNDGIALPAVLMLAALAASTPEGQGEDPWLRFGLLQVTLGPLCGIIVGWLGARLIDSSLDRQASAPPFQGILILALAVLAFALSEWIGGNGFIAAFVAGMVYGNVVQHQNPFLMDFMEGHGTLLMLITFMIFSLELLPEALPLIDGRVLAYAVLSLTVIRMLPIAFALIGTKSGLSTQLFLGWFGPRGLASILFVLLILEDSSLPHQDMLLAVTMTTVALSILLHGVTAAPLARRYGDRSNASDAPRL